MQQIVIDVPPEMRLAPEIIQDAQDLEREVYFSKLVSKQALTEFEIREYENFVQQFVTEDDEPVDNIFSERNQKILTSSLYSSWKPLNGDGKPRAFFATANVGLYARLNPKIAALVPDVLVSLDVTSPGGTKKQHRSYMTWEFGKPPDVVVEIVSNEIGDELGGKVQKYERIGIKYYAVFDPDAHLSETVLQVFELTENGYRLRSDFALPEASLGLTLRESEFEDWQAIWLRWTDENGNLLLTPEERAEKLAAKLRELGVDPAEI